MFTSRTFLSLTLLGSLIAGSASAGICMKSPVTMAMVEQKPKEIAWNVFNTLYTRELSNGMLYAKACAKHPLITTSLASRLGYAYATGTQNSIRHAIESMKQFPKFIAAEGYLQFFKDCGEYGLATIALEVALSNKPVPGMAALVKEIADNGIKQKVATNNSLRMQQLHQKRLKEEYNDATFDPITIGLTVDYSTWGPDEDIATENVTTFTKPNAEYFQHYNQLHNPDNSKVIIYICDSPEIVVEAAKYGWVGIFFDATKPEYSIEQLRRDLVSLGVLN